MSDEGKAAPGKDLKKGVVPVVQPKPKGMGTPVGAREAIDGVGGNSPLKMAGKK